MKRRRSKSKRALLGAVLAACISAAGSTVLAFESGRAEFSVRINDEIIPYEIFAVYALPRERLELEAIGAESDEYRITAAASEIQPAGPHRWDLIAPADPGLSTVVIEGSTDRLQLNLFVLHPASRIADRRLRGFRVGQYPATPLNDNPVYLPPDGFIELDESTASVRVSPHFTLGQFPSKQAGGYPKYLVLRERLLLKLELLLEEINRDGIAAETFTIMSGYRTPFYNAAIRNVPYSRHVYGGAADIYVDAEPVDDFMDDINRDGRLDFRDAQYLYRIAERLFARPEHRSLVGGLGVYRRNPAHGPFLHIDARGFRSRWGLIP